MASVPAPPRTPLRRISQGSLFRLSHSAAYPDAPHGLGFLEPALSELVDEVEALNTNVHGLRALSDALETFNESFASWLYVLNMNALTTDWPQAPTPESFALAARRAEEDARAAADALRAAQATPVALSPTLERTAPTDASDADNETTFATTTNAPAASAPAPAKKKGKPKMSAKEKRERGLAVEKVVTALPLEFRGGDPNLRRHIEAVIEKFIDKEGRGLGILEFVKMPDLNQARANKCLIALVNRKIVRKDNSTGAVLYHWQGIQ
ncbi:DASH complex subunit Dam1-domain-containing protein [Amylocystis lapponica]|nr:DASH complex subunit Dam1-domain-containing protein [Amylocystis lapponica]